MRFVSAAQLMAQSTHGSGVSLGVEFIEDMDVTAMIVSRRRIPLAVKSMLTGLVRYSVLNTIIGDMKASFSKYGEGRSV